MRILKTIVFAAAMLAVGTANAAGTPYILGCISTFRLMPHPNHTLSFQLRFKNNPSWVTLDTDGLKVVGTLLEVTPEQFAAQAPTVDLLKAAAVAKRKVDIFYNDHTKKVYFLDILWDKDC